MAFSGFDNEADGIAAISSIRKTAAVDCAYEFSAAKIEVYCAALVHLVDLRRALCLAPATDFPIRNHQRASAFCNADRVGDMIEMGVRNQNVVRRDFVDINGFGQFVRSDE